MVGPFERGAVMTSGFGNALQGYPDAARHTRLFLAHYLGLKSVKLARDVGREVGLGALAVRFALSIVAHGAIVSRRIWRSSADGRTPCALAAR